jgi:2-succinyl-6-hydroxy-2,4-cyclohexadiene-1-carboxylate synthase
MWSSTATHGPRWPARSAGDERFVLKHRDVALNDGLQLHVAIDGAGPPLVLLHGFTGSTETWAPLRATLETQHTVVAVDLPGHGRSSVPTDAARYALPRFADDLAAVLDALDFERVALMGYSLGGRAALHFAVRHPERLTALVVESASPGIVDPVARTKRVADDSALAAEIERDGIETFVQRWETLPLWKSQRTLAADTRAVLRAQRLANDPFGMANSLRGAGAGAVDALGGELARLTMPTLVVAGALDAKYVAIGEALAAAIAGARLAVVPESGHAVHLEQPDALAALVLEWIRTT